MIRLLLERISRGIVLKRKLTVPTGARYLYTSPEASLKYWLTDSLDSDMGLALFAERFVYSGSKIWDVGANVGIFAFMAASLSGEKGKVLAIEADPSMSALIQKSIVIQPQRDAPISLVTTAISSQPRLAKFTVAERSRASNHLSSSPGCTQTGGPRFFFELMCLTLDLLLEYTFAPQIVKMDIEGVEFEALQASPKLVSEVRPVFSLEVWESIAGPLSALLKESEYQLFDFERDHALTTPLKRCGWSTVAIPREQLEQARSTANSPGLSR